MGATRKVNTTLCRGTRRDKVRGIRLERLIASRPGIRQHRHTRSAPEPVVGSASPARSPVRCPWRRAGESEPPAPESDAAATSAQSGSTSTFMSMNSWAWECRRARCRRRVRLRSFAPAATAAAAAGAFEAPRDVGSWVLACALIADASDAPPTAYGRRETRSASRRCAARLRRRARRGGAGHCVVRGRRWFRYCRSSMTDGAALTGAGVTGTVGTAATGGTGACRRSPRGLPARRIPPRRPPGWRMATGTAPPAPEARTGPACERPSSRARRPARVTGRGSPTAARWPRRWRMEKRETAIHSGRATRPAVGRNPGCSS